MTLGVPAASVRGRGAARLRIRAVAAMTAACLVLAVACSGDDDSDSASPDDPTTSPRPTTTAPPEQSPGTEERVQDLLRSYDELTRDIAVDPAIASDPRNPLYDRLKELMAPDSDMIGPVINALVARGARGISQRVQGDRDLPVERLIEGDLQPVSDDVLDVPVCVHLNYGLFNGDDQQTELVEGRIEAAKATVVQVDDEFRIRRFESVDDNSRCREGR